MRQKMMLLTLFLAVLAGALVTAPAAAGGTYSCPQCTTYPSGFVCCIPCVCGPSGRPMACTDMACVDDI